MLQLNTAMCVSERETEREREREEERESERDKGRGDHISTQPSQWALTVLVSTKLPLGFDIEMPILLKCKVRYVLQLIKTFSTFCPFPVQIIQSISVLVRRFRIPGWGSKFGTTKFRTIYISKFQNCEY